MRLSTGATKAAFQRGIMEWIARRDLHLSVASHPELPQLFLPLCQIPGAIKSIEKAKAMMPHRKAMRKMAVESAQKLYARDRLRLGGQEYALTIDGWTSPANSSSYSSTNSKYVRNTFPEAPSPSCSLSLSLSEICLDLLKMMLQVTSV